MKRIGILAVAVLVAMAWFPGTAHACAVCFSASEKNREAFILTTAFLTFLPLGMVTGAGLWLRHRVKERDADEEASQQDSSSV